MKAYHHEAIEGNRNHLANLEARLNEYIEAHNQMKRTGAQDWALAFNQERIDEYKGRIKAIKKVIESKLNGRYWI